MRDSALLDIVQTLAGDYTEQEAAADSAPTFHSGVQFLTIQKDETSHDIRSFSLATETPTFEELKNPMFAVVQYVTYTPLCK